VNVADYGWLIGLCALALILGPLYALRGRQRFDQLPERLPERLDALIPQARWLSPAQRARWHRYCARFLITKRFSGCGGLHLTDEMRIAVAGLACLLVLREGAEVFPRLRTVLLYPDAFLVPQTEPDELGLVSDEPQEQIGESSSLGQVVLSWADVQAALQGDAVNVVAHEFAHQLDDETPDSEGAPPTPDVQRWASVMSAEFQRLRRHRRPPVLDPYGAESPAEFFAVVTEAYFQRGAELQRHHPELYALLRDYYGIETAQPAG
jgi:MtfA peptidase